MDFRSGILEMQTQTCTDAAISGPPKPALCRRTIKVLGLVAVAVTLALAAAVLLWPRYQAHARVVQPVTTGAQKPSVGYHFDGEPVSAADLVERMKPSASVAPQDVSNRVFQSQASSKPCVTTTAASFDIGTILKVASEAAKVCDQLSWIQTLVKQVGKACEAISVFDSLFNQSEKPYWFLIDCLQSRQLSGPADLANFYQKTVNFNTSAAGSVFNLRGSDGVRFQKVNTQNACPDNYFISSMYDLDSAQTLVMAITESILNMGATDVVIDRYELNVRPASNNFSDWRMRTGFILVPTASTSQVSSFTTCQGNLVPQPGGCVQHPEGLDQWLNEVRAGGETIVKAPKVHDPVYMLNITVQPPADGGSHSTWFGITAAHYLPLDCGSELVPASSVVVGDMLCLHGKPAKVKSMSSYWGQGYNVKTLSSGYTVNGVQVSHFASEPTAAQFYFARVVNLYHLASSWL